MNALAKRVEMDRTTLAAAEAGDPRTMDLTYTRIENWLDNFEAETGIDEATEDEFVEFRLSGNFGVDVVVKGPVSNLSELEESVSRLLEQMHGDHGD